MKVVAKKYYLGLTPGFTPITDDVIFTTTEGGDYQVNIALACLTGNDIPTVQVMWADVLENNQAVTANELAAPPTFALNLPPGGTIHVAISPNGDDDEVNANVYFSIVDLAAPGL